MLINFSIENWMSFRDKCTFSLVATRERQHGNRVPYIKKYKTKVLPVGVIYGGNASGKSNLMEALVFAKEFIINGIDPDETIPVAPFLLDNKNHSESLTTFTFEILAENIIYEFTFSVNSRKVQNEKLIMIGSNSEKLLYKREGSTFEYNEKIFEDNKFIDYVYKGTRNEKLFITNAISQNVKELLPIYNWFKKTLILISPTSSYKGINNLVEDELQNKLMSKTLSEFDTGISKIGLEKITTIEKMLSEEIIADMKKDLKDGEGGVVLNPITGKIDVKKVNGELTIEKICTYHKDQENNNIKFNIHQESDGTRRLIDLLPAFFDIIKLGANRVYFIDEFDRSLHTLLTKRLLNEYLDSCTLESRAQLVFSTHDVLLMDQDLLRRDEMWVTERNQEGATSIISFSDFKEVRYDKDIRKSYLLGRLGGIPRFLLKDSIGKSLDKKS
jgi:AAA15 family ATPase/GTPase